jgi:hypothetical protein
MKEEEGLFHDPSKQDQKASTEDESHIDESTQHVCGHSERTVLCTLVPIID